MSPELNERVLGLKALVVQLTMMFRQYRRAEFEFTVRGAKDFEDGLVVAGAKLSDLCGDFDAAILEAQRQLEDGRLMLVEAEKMIRKLGKADAMDPPPFAPESEVGEIDPQPAQFGGAYQPEVPRGWLKDMAVPAGATVVPFTGVFRTRNGGDTP
jgi:hypothetical protein